MQYALMIEPQIGGTYEDILAVARWAEDFGLDAIARSDHYQNGSQSAPAIDAFASLAALSRETSRIHLSVLVTPLTFRHPAVIAKTAASIDEMSGGRFELGIGTGWMEAEHAAFGLDLYELRERFSRLYETLAYVRTAFGRQPGPFDGRHYNLADIEVLPKPTGSLPIIVGGNGPLKTPTMAGRFGDEYNMFATDEDSYRARLKVMRDAADAAGRDPDAIAVSFLSSILIGEDEADYRDRLQVAAAKRGIEAAELEQRFADRNMPHGTPDQAAEIVAAYADLGIGRFYLQVFEPIGEIDVTDLERSFRAIQSER